MASALNGVPNTDPSFSHRAMATSASKQSTKPSFSNKNLEGNRKQPGSSTEGIQSKRNTAQKAWTSGMNPITQRSTAPTQSNGISPQPTYGSQNSSVSQETSTPDKHANDRLLYLLGSFVGLPASLTVANGSVFSGVFVGSVMEQHESAYLLKMVQQVSGPKSEANGVHDVFADYMGIGEDHAISFDTKDVIELSVEGVSFGDLDRKQNGSAAVFRTDADISGNLSIRERPLQRWDAPDQTDLDLSLDHSGGTWDQFEANAQKFGLKSDYDENIYTTRIDRSNPLHRQREAEAEQIAQEIEGGSTENSHVKEERGQASGNDAYDEEEKYSGVRRSGPEFPSLQSVHNKYTPPARRPPTGKPTVTGAPYDPAIISSQMARPESKNRKQPDAPLEHVTSLTAAPEKSDTNNVTEPTQKAPKLTPTVRETAATTARLAGSNKVPSSGVSATQNIEAEILDKFKQFSNHEKLRASDQRRQKQSQDKAVRLNDLLKFHQNFKLTTPVPKDLVPILAKDKQKQEEIIEKAQRVVMEAASTPPKNTMSPVDVKSQKLSSTPQPDSSPAPSTTFERPRGRQGYPSQRPEALQSSRDKQQQLNNGPGDFTHSRPSFGLRLADSHRQWKAGAQVPVPTPLPIHQISRNAPTRPAAYGAPSTSPEASSTVRTPTSAVSAKFNVKAHEFRPNPAASTFQPNVESRATTSPRPSAHVRPASRTASPSAFFGNKKPLPVAEKPSISDNFDPLKWLKSKAEDEGKTKDFAFNGGIQPAFVTPPTWRDPTKPDEQQFSYKNMFEDPVPMPSTASPQHPSPITAPMAHQHQLPLHLQSTPNGVPHAHQHHQPPFPVHAQPQHYPPGPHQYDDHRMHLSTSSSSVYPSPRLNNTHVAYGSPMPQAAQLTYGQPVPPYLMAPNGPHPTQFRQFPNGHQMIAAQGPQIGAPMMVQQSSSGGFISTPHGMAVPFNPQMQMYPAGQPPSFGGLSQPPSGYPSPGRGAPMMVQQGSHHGQPPPMYMNPGQFAQPVYAQQPGAHMTPMRGYVSPAPHYAQSPQPHYPYPPQPHRAVSNNYGSGPQAQHQHMGPQYPPPITSMDGGERGK